MIARIVSIACGLLMVAAVGIGSQHGTFVVAILAVLAVVAGTLVRPAATLAVLLTVVAIVLSDPPPTLAAASGLAAAAYLLLRHAVSTGTGLDTVSGSALVGAVGFTLVGLVATAFPLQLPWLPLAAPLAVVVIYLLAIRPFTVDPAPGGQGRPAEVPPDDEHG